jgi:hypothetical protein
MCNNIDIKNIVNLDPLDSTAHTNRIVKRNFEAIVKYVERTDPDQNAYDRSFVGIV